jgi:hypothetical protein
LREKEDVFFIFSLEIQYFILEDVKSLDSLGVFFNIAYTVLLINVHVPKISQTFQEDDDIVL